MSEFEIGYYKPMPRVKVKNNESEDWQYGFLKKVITRISTSERLYMAITDDDNYASFFLCQPHDDGKVHRSNKASHVDETTIFKAVKY